MASPTPDPKLTIVPDPEAYPTFLVHLREISTWLRKGCSMKKVWRAYAERGAFPGSYRTFLRYCSEHGLAPRRPTEAGEYVETRSETVLPPDRTDERVPKSPPLRGPKPVGSVLGRLNVFPPPLERPPGFIPEED